jgi:hypothetical protein
MWRGAKVLVLSSCYVTAQALQIDHQCLDRTHNNQSESKPDELHPELNNLSLFGVNG